MLKKTVPYVSLSINKKVGVENLIRWNSYPIFSLCVKVQSNYKFMEHEKPVEIVGETSSGRVHNTPLVAQGRGER